MRLSPPILAVLIVAVLISIAASLAGGFMMYFEGLSSLEDTVRETSNTELQALDLQLRAAMSHTENLNMQMKTFFFSPERMSGLDPEVWGNVMRSFVYSLIKTNQHMYGGGVVLVPWDVTNSSAFSASVWGNPNRDGGKYFVYGLYASHLPSSFFVVDNSTSPGTLQRMGVHTSIVHNVTGELLHYAYQWDGKMYVTTVLGDFNPRLGGKPSPPLWEALPNTGYQPPVAERWRNPSVWRTNDGFAFTYTANDMVFEPPPHPHPWSTYRAVLIYNAVRFESWSEVVAQYAARHPDTTVVITDPASGEIIASTTGHQMVAQDCLAQLSGRLNPCPTKMYNMSQAVQGAFRRTRGDQTGSFNTMELDGKQYFVRRYDLDFKGYIVLWLRPTSSVQGKVQEALVLLILFTALVLIFDVTIMVLELVFIAMPMRQLSSAIISVGNMETEDANQFISMYRQRSVMLKEVRSLMEGMTATIGRLEEFRTFMPEAIFSSEPVLVGSQQQQEAPGSETGHAAVLFTDVQGSTKLWEACTEEMAEALRLHNTVIREMIQEHGGYEVKTIGDSFMVSFPDIDTAVWFGLHTQERLFQAAWPAELLEVVQAPGDERRGLCGLRVRMGVTHGAVNVEMNEVVKRCDYFGPTVNRAARLEANGVCGGVAVEASVVDSITAVQQKQALVVQLGKRVLKGIGDIPLCLLVPLSMPQRAAHVHDADVHNPLNIVSQASSFTSTCSRGLHSTQGPSSPRRIAVERFGSDKLSEVGSATTGYVDCEVADLPCAEVNAMADNNLRGVVACVGRSDGRLLNVCGTAALVAWNVMSPCAGHLEAALRFASMMSGRAACGVNCGLSSGKVFSGYVETGKKRYVTAVGQCVQVSQRAHLMAVQTEQVALFAAKDTQVTEAMVAHGLATAAGELRKGAGVFTVCALLCHVIASRVDRKQGLFNHATSAAMGEPAF